MNEQDKEVSMTQVKEITREIDDKLDYIQNTFMCISKAASSSARRFRTAAIVHTRDSLAVIDKINKELFKLNKLFIESNITIIHNAISIKKKKKSAKRGK